MAELILDSGCGTGLSSRRLAERHPDRVVIGVDRSEARLSRAESIPDNCFLVRAELAGLWQLIARSSLRVTEHHVYYPNPYPKARHLQRRWYGHPVFPVVMGLAPQTQVRANWLLYLEEWRVAAGALGFSSELNVLEPSSEPMTLFERKYWATGTPTWSLWLDKK
ncbi:MAG: methyltransferase domain-containing protein [Myxococcales bacterium]|nr:methyltransferase domain-containing protein [Myxococcales bacterium]